MKSLKKILFIAALSVISNYLLADKWQGTQADAIPTLRSTELCEPGQTSTELGVNNVRALIHTAGDMWWDLQGKAYYIVPADGSTSALFAGAIWVGGKDANNQLKVAAQKFRQNGNDYWPGPLITSGAAIATVTQDICREYDKHFFITKNMVKEFREWFDCSQDSECNTEEQFPLYSIPDIIMNWPAHGPEGGYDYNLAPFWDTDGDGYYNPLMGDFPYYEFVNNGITDDPDCLRPRNRMPKLFGDETLWWVYNDKGNIHTETGGASIGMEFRAQAFAFTTNDELNDMTFYNYNIINRSTYTLFETFFGVWTDADLGYAKDDFCGCDVMRGLGYMYNGDNNDETADGIQGYGAQPPAIGIDFFEGPYQDPDGLDNRTSFDTVNGVKVLNCDKGDILNGNINGLNFQDGTVDNERWGMRRFLYFNNAGTGDNENTLDPHTAGEHYNYLTGFWLDNTPLTYGGTGHYSGGGSDIKTDFMFPGTPTTDPCGWGQGGIPQGSWSEEEPLGPGSTPNSPRDVRFVQSAGPFTLYPGAVNDITIGAVYARAPSGGPWASVEAVRRADDKAQILFENCFRVLNGPDAPELKIVEMDKKLIFHIYNKSGSNNYLETYVEKDPSIVCASDIDPCDEYYRFQGYQVFQYKNPRVSISDRYNDGLVRQVFQCDIKDDISQVVNYKWSDELSANVPVLEVNGNNNGIIHTFVVDNDLFASGDPRLINNREYYYSVLAYGYNNSMLYNQSIQETFNGQKKPYLAGRNNIKRYTALPHINDPENGGTIVQGDYGYGPKITMIEGHGNGNNILELTQETIDEIMSGYPWKATNRTYNNGKGPINVKIIDPLNVPEDIYTLKFNPNAISRPSNGFLGHKNGDNLSNRKDFIPFSYTIVNSSGDEIESEVFIQYNDNYEHLFMDWGFSITISQVNYAGYCNRNNYQNGFLTASIKFEDKTKPWLYFVPDGDGQDALNWIRVGTQSTDNAINPCIDGSFDDYKITGGEFYDKYQNFEKILGGTWGPFLFTSDKKYGLSDPTVRASLQPYIKPLTSVKLVITSDKSKWSRSCVVEMCENEWTKEADCPLIDELVTPKVNYRSIGNALKFTLRKSPSVDKEGNPLNDGTHGLSWFPGYAIDLNTGERLNIVFGEDSWMTGENGADMVWNPTSYPYDNYMTGLYSDLGPRFGGKHYIYIMRNERLYSAQAARNVPAYDSCKFIYDNFVKYENSNYVSIIDFRSIWNSAMWCAIPMKREGFDLLATDVSIDINVSMPYHKGQYDYAVDNPQNDNFPMFTFNTADVKTIKQNLNQAENALDLIRVVPNPYYGNSYYENTQLDNYVRITNLPKTCAISIYNASGGLVRRYDKDNDVTFIQWDMKNTYGISIASGVYIVHVNVPGVGEKIVKWFGALRPIDLNNF
ncbi:MAG: hypothetical protein PHP52_07135 [Bacteroidales bacterium]|nr:hypothetical protein [Bacteroidales bacterium]MDD4216226.1 hypothetical protein [Bacteroidales bacterium]